MKKTISLLLSLIMCIALCVPAFATVQEEQVSAFSDFVRIEVPVTRELSTAVTATLSHEDGTFETLQPEIRCYRLIDTARSVESLQGELYLVEMYSSTKVKSDATDSGKCDASLSASMVYLATWGEANILKEVHASFRIGPEIILQDCTIEYGAMLGERVTDTMYNQDLTYDRYNINIASDGVNGLIFGITRDLETWGVTDTLTVSLRTLG